MSLALIQTAQKSVTGTNDTNEEMAHVYMDKLNYVEQVRVLLSLLKFYILFLCC